MFGGLTHEPAAQLAHRLSRLCSSTTGELPHVFFSDSGSVSVEVALKMALQFQRGVHKPFKDRFLTWRNGYHGDTQGPMSVCDPEGGMHALWEGTLTRQVFVPAPPPRGCGARAREEFLDATRATIERHNASEHGIAAVVIEPIVQGAGGMRFHDAELVAGMREVCNSTGTLLILDEIATGFGRTGETFACHAAGIAPDILCLGKALTGGFMSFAATLTTDRVARSIETAEGGGALMHGPTFMGNPLACAVGNAALDLVESEYWRPQVAMIERELRRGLEPLMASGRGVDSGAVRGRGIVADARVLGAIGVVELSAEHGGVDMRTATRVAIEHGVWLRPFGRLVYAMPPFVCDEAEIASICAAIRAVVEEEAKN